MSAPACVAPSPSPSPSPLPLTSGVSPAVPAWEAPSTPLWALKNDEEASLSASAASPQRSACASGASSPPLPGDALPATQPTVLSTHLVVRQVQEACSDLVFLLEESGEAQPSPPSPSSLPEENSAENGETPSPAPRGPQSKVVPLVGSYSNADVIRGAMRRAGGGALSVASSSSQVAFLVPVLLEAVAWRQPLVVHVGAYQLNETLGLESAPWQGLEWIKASGCAILFSSCPQEAHDMAVLAHLLALRTRQPVVHWYDGLMAREVYAPLQAVAPSTWSAWWEENGRTLFSSSSTSTSDSSSSSSSSESFSEALAWGLEMVEQSWHRSYQGMERSGSEQARQVLVTWVGSPAVERAPASWGVVQVRLYRPWQPAALCALWPASTRTVWVEHGALQRDVALALQSAPLGSRPVVRVWASASPQEQEEWALPSLCTGEEEQAESLPWQSVVEIMNVPSSWTGETALSQGPQEAQRVAQFVEAYPALAQGPLLVRRNGYRHHTAERWLVSTRPLSAPTLLAVEQVQWTLCASRTLLDAVCVQSLASEGARLVVFPSTEEEDSQEETWKGESPVSSEPDSWPLLAVAPSVRQALEEKQVTLYFAPSCAQALQWLAQPESLPPAHVSPAQLGEWLAREEAAQESQEEEEEPSETMKQAADALARLGSLRTSTLFRGEASRGRPQEQGQEQTKDGQQQERWNWRFLFPEAYQVEKRLKPHARESHGLYQVQVTQWLRLTPESYDRNVFHLEMDISHTHLRYEIGDALGVYGHNCPQAVLDFVQAYAPHTSPQQMVALPLPGQSGALQLRSLEQILTQDVDLFGRPTKRLYARLAPHATDPNQESLLRELGEGAAEENFRQRSEEGMTIAEVLLEFTSARPSWPELVEIVGAIKPRHYSIASSMNMHPDSVHLLVVDHTWVTPKGKLRRGQCTRYLQGLRKGDTVTVSVKPSIMKLPASHSTPIVMAGLGTGMAPFRAFLQERLYQQQVNKVDIGEMVLYFGSRSSREEYLYGEELEAYLAMGTLTHVGLAFSRDQAHKIYIQHKIQEDGPLLWRLLHAQRGTFYLCGPTWPAGDVQDAITANLEKEGAWSAQRAIDEIIAMKAAERYILEVY